MHCRVGLRAIFVVAALAGAPVPAQTLVQQASQNTPASGSCDSAPSALTATFPAPTTVGNTLVVFLFQTTDSLRSVAGGGVTTWTPIIDKADSQEGALWFGRVTSAATTVTVSWGNTPVNCGFAVAEFAGVPVPATTTRRLQVLWPGETAMPNSLTGKSGTPAPVTAGSTVNVTVNAVDANWNLIPTATPLVHLTSTDATATLPADAMLVNGTLTFAVRMRTVGSSSINAHAVAPEVETAAMSVDGGTTSLLTPTLTTTAGGLLVGLAAQHATPAGVLQTANGNALNTVVSTNLGSTWAIQPAWQAIPGPGGWALSWSNPNAVIGWFTLAGALTSGGAWNTIESAQVSVGAGAFARLRLLVPGVTAVTGSTAPWRTGTPSGEQPGFTFNATIEAIDSSGNVVTSATDVVHLASSDISAVLPANQALASGRATMSVMLNQPGSWSLTVTDVTTPARPGDSIASIPVALTFFKATGTVTPAVDGAGTSLSLTGVSTASATADATGAWSATGLLPGTWLITPTKPGYTFTPASRSITLAADQAGLDFVATAIDAGAGGGGGAGTGGGTGTGGGSGVGGGSATGGGGGTTGGGGGTGGGDPADGGVTGTRVLQVGCGCGSTGADAWLAALLCWQVRRRQKATPRPSRASGNTR
ncbi:MAG: hypothetical protein U0228_04920 [Myxococcaceae bacterium]